MKKIISITIGIVFLFGIYSCDSGRVVVSSRYDVPVYDRPPRPYPNYVWIEGDWYPSNGRYEYRRGYWGPPRVHRTYYPGTWQQTSGGFYWRRGRWH